MLELDSDSLTIALLLMAIWSEWRALPLPNGGHFTISMVFWSALCWRNPQQLPAVLLLATALIVGRNALSPRRDGGCEQALPSHPKEPNADASAARPSGSPQSDGLPLCIGEALSLILPLTAGNLLPAQLPQSWPQPWSDMITLLVVALIYTVAQCTWPELLVQVNRDSGEERPTPALWWLTLALPCMGFGIAKSSSGQPWQLWLWLAVLPALHSAGRAALQALQARDTSRLNRHLNVTNHHLTQARHATAESNRRLSDMTLRQQQQAYLNTVLQGCTSLEQLHRATTALCHHFWQAQSVVIFQATPGGLSPTYWSSPQGDLLAAWDLLGCRETTAEKALEKSQPISDDSPELATATLPPSANSPGRAALPPLTLADRHKLSLPLNDWGVLYIGNSSETTFTDHDRDLGSYLGELLASNGQRLSQLSQQRQHLDELNQSNAALQSRSAKLEEALRSLPRICQLDSPRELLRELENTVRSLVTAQHVTVMVNAEQLASGTETGAEATAFLTAGLIANTSSGQDDDARQTELSSEQRKQLQALSDLWDAVATNRVPLLLHDISASRFASPSPECVSLLAVPMLYGEQMMAAIVAESPQREAFTRQDQDVLFILGYQVAVALHNCQLHHRLQIAHLELANSQASLIQSSKLAAVGQLAAGVAHELNTPLGAIMLGLDSALQNLGKGEVQRAQARLGKAQSAATKAKSIVSKLLFYSREARLNVEPADLNEIVSDTLEFIGYHLRNASIEVRTDLAPLPSCEVNRNEIQQIITNLVLNARDALSELPASIMRQLSIVTEYDQPQGQLCLRIYDNGPGIASDIIDRIFDPFFTTKQVNQGTGLGLSISRQLAQRNQGELTVRSQPGQTEFELRLSA